MPAVKGRDDRYSAVGVETGQAEVLGRFIGLDGTRKAARLNPVEAQIVMDLAVEEIASEEGVAIDTFVAESQKEFETAPGATGGKRRAMKGGNLGDKLRYLKTLAMLAVYFGKNVTSTALSASAEYIKREILEPIWGSGNITIGTLQLTQEAFIRAPVTAVILVKAFAEGTVNIGTNLLSTFNTGARGLAAKVRDPAFAKEVVTKALEVRNLPATLITSIAVVSQAGLVGIGTIAAMILKGIGVATTGVGRAAMTLAVYIWYIRQPDAKKKVIEKAGGEILANVANATGDAGKKLGELAVEAVTSDAVKASLTTSVAAAKAALGAAASAIAQPIAAPMRAIAATVSSEETEEPPAQVAAIETLVADPSKAAAEIQSSVVAVVSTTAPSNKETEEKKKKVKKAAEEAIKLNEEVDAGIPEVRRSLRRRPLGPPSSSGGKRKTRKSKSPPKRRVTHRRRPRLFYY